MCTYYAIPDCLFLTCRLEINQMNYYSWSCVVRNNTMIPFDELTEMFPIWVVLMNIHPLPVRGDKDLVRDCFYLFIIKISKEMVSFIVGLMYSTLSQVFQYLGGRSWMSNSSNSILNRQNTSSPKCDEDIFADLTINNVWI
jgi:hypothetical protein